MRSTRGLGHTNACLLVTGQAQKAEEIWRLVEYGRSAAFLVMLAAQALGKGQSRTSTEERKKKGNIPTTSPKDVLQTRQSQLASAEQPQPDQRQPRQVPEQWELEASHDSSEEESKVPGQKVLQRVQKTQRLG